MTTQNVIDHLSYLNYRYNRQIAPHVEVERWAKVYGAEQVKLMEARYQEEINRKEEGKHAGANL